jgi:hypothetical protein
MALIESLIGNTAGLVLGNPVFSGIIILLFFIGLAAIAKVSFEASLVFLVPAFILSFAFIPALRLIIGIMFGVLIGLMFLKLYSAR